MLGRVRINCVSRSIHTARHARRNWTPESRRAVSIGYETIRPPSVSCGGATVVVFTEDHSTTSFITAAAAAAAASPVHATVDLLSRQTQRSGSNEGGTSGLNPTYLGF